MATTSQSVTEMRRTLAELARQSQREAVQTFLNGASRSPATRGGRTSTFHAVNPLDKHLVLARTRPDDD